jgi:hypothetical protein
MPGEPLRDKGPAHLRQRLLGDIFNVELRQKYVATRGPELERADLRLARRWVRAARLLGGSVGMAVLGALGSVIGAWLLASLSQPSGGFPAAAKVGVGSALLAGGVFGLLGALGHVVFAELIGDYSETEERRFPSSWASLVDGAVEFIGGAIWGIVCGAATGVVVGSASHLLGITIEGWPGLIISGAAGGGVLGLLLAALALILPRGAGPVGAEHAALGPLPLHAYFFSPERLRQKFLRRPRQGFLCPDVGS